MTDSTPTAPLPKCLTLYVNWEDIRRSGLLSAARLEEVAAEVERRILTPCLPDGRVIANAAVADLSPWPLMMYPRMDHDPKGEYLRRAIAAVVLTEGERKLLEAHSFSAARDRKDEKRFAKAVKIREEDWGGGVFLDDTYYADTEALHEHLMEVVDDPADYPEYAWPAKPYVVIPEMFAADVLEHWVTDRGWEDMTVEDDLEGVPTLQAALDAFTEANRSVVSYEPNYDTAVLLNIPSRAP